MATSGDAAPAAGAGGGWEDNLWSMGKNIAIFVAVQYGIRQFMGGSQKASPAVAPDNAASTGAGGEVVYDYSAVPQTVFPLWPADTSVDVSMYISPSVAMPPLHAMPRGSLIFQERNFTLNQNYGLFDKSSDTRQISTSFSVPKQVQNNGTLWAHIFVAQTGAELDPASSHYDAGKAYRVLRPLTQYLARKKVRKTRNLLEAKNETVEGEPEVEEGPQIASYYHPNVTLSFVLNPGSPNYPSMHPAVRQFYTLESTGARDASGKNGWYYPVVYTNTFWQMKKDMTELNSTIPFDTLPINVNLNTLANWQFSLMASMDEGMKETARKTARGETTTGGGDGSEMELIKEVLLDSNIYLLSVTAVVSVLHMIFELLAFKSDVGHWRKKKDNVGVSVRTILTNVFMQSVIFLYLMDNNENTSWMILFGQGMGIAIEAWKITKTVDVRIRQPSPESYAGKLGLPYTVVFEDKHKLSETEEKTEEYDAIAFRYMGMLAVPLLGAYAVYSLKYDTHKSWYSFIITTLVGSVYAYGFLMMVRRSLKTNFPSPANTSSKVPSLYINYRLKSVAHMPAKAMTYKFLNTFIDDLFAFTIKMPTLHRLATLRDDVIFFVYIYQAWAYKVDYKRVNEFGMGGDEETVEDKKGAKPLTAPPESKDGPDEAKKAAEKVNGAVSTGANKGNAKKRKG